MSDNVTQLQQTAYGLPADQLHAILREVADFNAIYETIQDKLTIREHALEQKLAIASQQIRQQLAEVQHSLETFANFMTEEGAARARMIMKQAREEGQTSLRSLQTVSAEINQTLEAANSKLEHITTQTLTNIAEITNTFPVDEFKQVTQKGCEDIKSVSNSAIKQMTGFISLFHRKNLIMAFVLSLFMVFVLGLFLNGEWPWEIHQDVVKERTAGRALLSAWPKLTPAEQQAIINGANHNPFL